MKKKIAVAVSIIAAPFYIQCGNVYSTGGKIVSGESENSHIDEADEMVVNLWNSKGCDTSNWNSNCDYLCWRITKKEVIAKIVSWIRDTTGMDNQPSGTATIDQGQVYYFKNGKLFKAVFIVAIGEVSAIRMWDDLMRIVAQEEKCKFYSPESLKEGVETEARKIPK